MVFGFSILSLLHVFWVWDLRLPKPVSLEHDSVGDWVEHRLAGKGCGLRVFEMYKTYGNIMRLRQILSVLARHGFSHFLSQIHIFEYAPWLGRLIEPGAKDKNATDDLPTRLAQAFQELGPAFIKLGQLLATRPDIVSPDFQKAFAKLQDEVEPLPGNTIVPILEGSLGKSVGEVFASFTHEAAASGSIGQVHYAELLDGTQVVVKIKRPGIDKTIEEDLSLLASLAELVEKHIPELAVVRPVSTIAEFRRAMEYELDFVGEASCAEKFRDSMGDPPIVKVPVVYWDYVSRGVLVTERLRGKPLSQATNLSLKIRRSIAAKLVECFMHQYFETGFFHSDPHPGNIFILVDCHVGLLDFGQVGHLSEELRHVLAAILIALRDLDTDAMVNLYSEVGEFSPNANIQGFRYDLTNLIDRHYGVPADRVDFSLLSQEVLSVARRNGLHLPRNFVLLIKSFVTIAGVVQQLDPDFRLDEAVRPFARRLVMNLYSPANLAKRGWNLASRFMSLFRRMPDDARDLLEKARAGKLTIVFHHENLNNVAERTGRAVDRLTLGIIIAAIIISSSIILVSNPGSMPGGDTPIISGLTFSALFSAAGFIGATLVGIYVAWGIFRDKN